MPFSRSTSIIHIMTSCINFPTFRIHTPPFERISRHLFIPPHPQNINQTTLICITVPILLILNKQHPRCPFASTLNLTTTPTNKQKTILNQTLLDSVFYHEVLNTAVGVVGEKYECSWRFHGDSVVQNSGVRCSRRVSSLPKIRDRQLD